MSMFNHIQAAPADPILGLGEAFKAEQRAGKINLGIGVYMNAEGKTPIVKAVKKAEALLLEQETNKNYLTIDGVQAFNAYTQELLFGKGAEIIASGRAKTAQSLGVRAHYVLRRNLSNAKRQQKISGFQTRLGRTTMQLPKRSV